MRNHMSQNHLNKLFEFEEILKKFLKGRTKQKDINYTLKKENNSKTYLERYYYPFKIEVVLTDKLDRKTGDYKLIHKNMYLVNSYISKRIIVVKWEEHYKPESWKHVREDRGIDSVYVSDLKSIKDRLKFSNYLFSFFYFENMSSKFNPDKRVQEFKPLGFIDPLTEIDYPDHPYYSEVDMKPESECAE